MDYKKAQHFYDIKLKKICFQKLLINAKEKGYKAQRYNFPVSINEYDGQTRAQSERTGDVVIIMDFEMRFLKKTCIF